MLKIIFVIGFVAWAILGDPKNDIANYIWSESNAPWENVDGYYYPNKDVRAVNLTKKHVGSLNDCRDWAKRHAKAARDIEFRKAGYECGIGMVKKADGTKEYRLLAK